MVALITDDLCGKVFMDDCQLVTAQHIVHDTVRFWSPTEEVSPMLSDRSGGSSAGCITIDGRRIQWRTRPLLMSNKLRNREIHAMNGNRLIRTIIKVAYWNIGNGLWENKRTEIELLILEKSPDILFIAEAYIGESLQDHERHIEGYKLHYPGTLSKHHYTRLVLLVKNELNVTVRNDLMHEDVAAIWVSIRNGNKKSMIIGGVYREHRLLCQPKPNLTVDDAAQLRRWNYFLELWKKAARTNMCVLVGDTNLDFLRWENPHPNQEKMVERTKEVAEESGFSQLIKGVTRTWRGQVDSLLDQCWVNNPQRVISHENEVRGRSDHNLITVLLRTKDRYPSSQELFKRQWKNFDPVHFRTLVSQIDWKFFNETKNVELKNSIFEEKINDILDSLAPYKNIQLREKNSEIGLMTSSGV